MNHAREQVEFIASSLKVETKKMDSDKASDFKNALLALANIQLEYHAQSRLAWENLVPSLQVSDIEIQDSQLRAQRRVSCRKPGEKNQGVGQIIGLL